MPSVTLMSMTPALASVFDSLQDVSSLVFAVLAFAVVFLVLKGFEHV
jgi:hypothetical protein